MSSPLSPDRLDHIWSARPSAVIIGLFGLPRNGKSTLLRQLEQHLGTKRFEFYDLSEMIEEEVPGGQAEFTQMSDHARIQWRGRLIWNIKQAHEESSQAAVVATHVTAWNLRERTAKPRFFNNDLKIFTHVVYLDPTIEQVMAMRSSSKARDSGASKAELTELREMELLNLRSICYHDHIPFSTVSLEPMVVHKVSGLLEDFQSHTVQGNLSKMKCQLDKDIGGAVDHVKRVVVMDADLTITPADTRIMFWAKAMESFQLPDEDNPWITVIKSRLGVSYMAYRQASLLYDEVIPERCPVRGPRRDFDWVCDEVAEKVKIYPSVRLLLCLIAEHDHIKVVIVTSGLRDIWQRVLNRECLSHKVKLIGSGRSSDPQAVIMGDEVKTAIVQRLKRIHHKHVWVIGSGPQDIGMLKKSDQAIVISHPYRELLGDVMDVSLQVAIDDFGLKAQQVLIPNTGTRRLDFKKLPPIMLTRTKFVDTLLEVQHEGCNVAVYEEDDPKAIEMFWTTNAEFSTWDLSLKDNHQDTGDYLARRFVTDIVREEVMNAEGLNVSRNLPFDAENTIIISLLPNGTPMASGVNQVYPPAEMWGCEEPGEIKYSLLENHITIILVDPIVKDATNIIAFVRRVNTLHATIRIIILAGTIRATAVEQIRKACSDIRYNKISLVTLEVVAL